MAEANQPSREQSEAVQLLAREPEKVKDERRPKHPSAILFVQIFGWVVEHYKRLFEKANKENKTSDASLIRKPQEPVSDKNQYRWKSVDADRLLMNCARSLKNRTKVSIMVSAGRFFSQKSAGFM